MRDGTIQVFSHVLHNLPSGRETTSPSDLCRRLMLSLQGCVWCWWAASPTTQQSGSCCLALSRLNKAAENPPNAESRCLMAADCEGGLCHSAHGGEEGGAEQRWTPVHRQLWWGIIMIIMNLCSVLLGCRAFTVSSVESTGMWLDSSEPRPQPHLWWTGTPCGLVGANPCSRLPNSGGKAETQKRPGWFEFRQFSFF